MLSNGYGFYSGTFLTGTTLSDGGWHEVTANLAAPAADSGSTFNPALINGIGAQLLTQGAQADGGPATPAPATVLLDDIWLE